MPTHATDDIVVFLPGITGSVLAKDGRDVWGVSASSIFRAVVSGGDSIRELALEVPDDPSLDDLGDGVAATRLVPDVHLIPGFWKIDGYSKLVQDIQGAFGLEEGESLFQFPYDWRRDNRVAARKLQRSIGSWLRERRRTRPGAKAVLVAHSMGGLVSRYYLEVLGGWSDVRTLVTFGTPYGGSLKALGFITNGYRLGVGPLGFDLAPLLRSFTSVYQLLPTYECVDPGTGPLRMVGDVPGLPNVDYARVSAALAFHDEMAAQVRARVAGGPPPIVPVVGIEQPTLQSARAGGSQLDLLQNRNGTDEGGDGTVPRVSAVPFELLALEREVYAAEAHGSLQNHDGVLAQLRGVLSRPGIEIRRTRPGGPIGLSLSLADTVPAGQIVEVSVRPSRERPTLAATLSTAEGQQVAQVPCRPQRDGSQRAAFDPPPEGIYRIRVEATGPDVTRVSPVTDIFVVAGQ
jgi:pimeloyl-ACP methyl ester carboxylesterase